MINPPRRYMKMTKSNPNDWADFWFDQIGWVGYFFAQLEWASYWIADVAGSKAQQHEIKSRAFCARAKYANKHIVPRLIDNSLQLEWQAFFKKCMQSAKMRNDILHNPLEITLSDISTTGVKIDQGIRLMQGGGRKVIQLGDVQNFTDGLRALNETMLDLMRRTTSFK